MSDKTNNPPAWWYAMELAGMRCIAEECRLLAGGDHQQHYKEFWYRRSAQAHDAAADTFERVMAGEPDPRDLALEEAAKVCDGMGDPDDWHDDEGDELVCDVVSAAEAADWLAEKIREMKTQQPQETKGETQCSSKSHEPNGPPAATS